MEAVRSAGRKPKVSRDQVLDAAAATPELSDTHDIKVRQVEGKLFISLDAMVDGNLSVSLAHDLSTKLQEAIRAIVPNVGEVLVHLEPQIEHNAKPHIESQ